MTKLILRKAILARRQALSAIEKSVADDAIQNVFLAMPEYLNAGSVALYLPINNEVSTAKVVTHALLTGKALFLPAVEGDAMDFRRINGLDDLVVGRFGIMQPGCGCNVANPKDIEMIVVPGVGFDLSGQRIGYGKGYYDRALHQSEGSGRLTAFCYEFQLVDLLEGEKHDVVMDRIITEHRVVNCSAKIKREN